MGLGSKLKTCNTSADKYLQGAKMPVSDGGYNSANISTLGQMPQMSPSEIQNVQKVMGCNK